MPAAVGERNTAMKTASFHRPDRIGAASTIAHNEASHERPTPLQIHHFRRDSAQQKYTPRPAPAVVITIANKHPTSGSAGKTHGTATAMFTNDSTTNSSMSLIVN